jgi:NTP pyrophosphatase (non-canonical NTP hydrolase)
MSDLTFSALRSANIRRLPLFKNAKGEKAHSTDDGSDWTPSQWLQAVVGELGEYANIRKKFERGDIDNVQFRTLAEKELADVQVYLDILAFRLGIDLGKATIDKFNAVSDRVGCNVYLNDYYVYFNGVSVFVKEGYFFRAQGGDVESWGKDWTCVYADSIEDARHKGFQILEVAHGSNPPK